MAARQDPKTVFSAAVSLDYADRLSARVILERALRTAGGDPEKTRHGVVVRRADGEEWKDRGRPLPALGASRRFRVPGQQANFVRQDAGVAHRRLSLPRHPEDLRRRTRRPQSRRRGSVQASDRLR